MKEYFHSVTLDKEKCKGCTNCIKHCPTEAIRVRNGKAKIIRERCIDCGECIRVCPYHAKNAITDDFEKIYNYKYTIVLPAPALYVQFKNNPDINVILNGLEKIGFSKVFEVARAAELVTLATKEYMKSKNLRKPIISSACPAVMRLIMVRFPNLIENVVPLLAPIELAAILAKEKAIVETGLKAEEIGVFFITPCAAKVTCSYLPIGVESSLIDGCISIKDIYKKLLPVVKQNKVYEHVATSSIEGITWAKNGGESSVLETDNVIAVDGIHNVINIFEQLEDDLLDDIDFVEASACVGGCIGGPLTVENPFVARTRIKNVLQNTSLVPSGLEWCNTLYEAVKWKNAMTFEPVMKLDDDMIVAMQKLEQIETISNQMPKLDCGSCGAPSCHALAEDIVRGHAKDVDCVFKLRDRIRELAEEMLKLESITWGEKPNDRNE